MVDIIEKYDDHEDRSVTRLLDQFKNADKLRALIKTYAKQIQDLEDAVFEVILERVLGNAVGVQLTQLGKIVGQPRITSDDDDFSVIVNSKIAINLSHGTTPELVDILQLILFANNETFFFRDEPPAQLRVTIIDSLTVDPALVRTLLDSADAAGVRILVDYNSSLDNDDKFRFSDQGGGAATGKGFGDTGAGATEIGYLASTEA